MSKFLALCATAIVLLSAAAWAGSETTSAPMAIPAVPETLATATVVAPAADLVPPQNAAQLDGQLPDGNYPLLRLTPDKIEIVKLTRDATNIIVGNSRHLLSVLETPRQVLLIPRTPGATHFQALDAQGNTIMERAVIVAAPTQDYVRVRRTCAANSPNCHEFSMFYCPDMCHEIQMDQSSSTSNSGDTGITMPDTTASTAPSPTNEPGSMPEPEPATTAPAVGGGQ
jgi:hypothetical protein